MAGRDKAGEACLGWDWPGPARQGMAGRAWPGAVGPVLAGLGMVFVSKFKEFLR
jgi:hypothetical protein